jgi:thiamine monophosphate kinase
VYDNVPENELTDEQLIKILKGEDRYAMVGTADHPEFAKLRDALEEQGYITCWRNCWNGDKVLKPFILNGKTFKERETFPCGSAMRGHLKYKR